MEQTGSNIDNIYNFATFDKQNLFRMKLKLTNIQAANLYNALSILLQDKIQFGVRIAVKTNLIALHEPYKLIVDLWNDTITMPLDEQRLAQEQINKTQNEVAKEYDLKSLKLADIEHLVLPNIEADMIEMLIEKEQLTTE